MSDNSGQTSATGQQHICEAEESVKITPIPARVQSSTESTAESESLVEETNPQPLVENPTYQLVEFEEVLCLEPYSDMDQSMVTVGQLKFTGDPQGPSLTHLRQSWAATEVDLKLKPAAQELTDNDRFHLLVRLTGGQARA